MLKLEQIRAKSLLFLISGIVVLSVIFIIISCGGYGPQLKVRDSDKGHYAIDFSAAPGLCGDPPTTRCAAATAANGFFPSIEGNELTVEAWVKNKATSTAALNGSIFSRYDSKGIALWVKEGKPKFAIIHPPYSGCAASLPTSTPCTVESNVTLAIDKWYHIAGVLVNEAHPNHPTTTPGITCADSDGNTKFDKDEVPHLDIYVDGEFRGCTSTRTVGVYDPDKYASQDPTVDVANIGALSYVSDKDPFDSFTTNPLFEGVIDEVRLWTVARTPEQINNCKDQELSLTGGGDCSINSSILKGYWRFNEGPGPGETGSSFMDSSGHGSGGGIESPSKILWGDGWVDEGWH